MIIKRCLFLALMFISITVAAGGDPPKTVKGDRKVDQAALKAYCGLVGSWRGVGMPLRQNAKGAWTESAQWAWKLTDHSAGLEVKIEHGKYLKSALLRPGKEDGEFELDAKLTDDSDRAFKGKKGQHDAIVLGALDQREGGLRRITLTPLHDTRFLMLLESQNEKGGRFNRLGEVGFTRNGVAFAAGESYPKCIVTEGKGTIKVSYKGETYYVCCSGCKELFDEKPDEILAEAAERNKKKGRKDE